MVNSYEGLSVLLVTGVLGMLQVARLPPKNEQTVVRVLKISLLHKKRDQVSANKLGVCCCCGQDTATAVS